MHMSTPFLHAVKACRHEGPLKSLSEVLPRAMLFIKIYVNALIFGHIHSIFIVAYISDDRNFLRQGQPGTLTLFEMAGISQQQRLFRSLGFDTKGSK